MAPRVSQSITAEFVLKFNEQKGKNERKKANNKAMLSNANAKSKINRR